MLNHDHTKPPLFHRAIMESGSPTCRAVRPYNAKIHEEQFQDFLREVNCPGDLDKTEMFPYLRSLPSSKITEAQIMVFDKYNPSLRWPFQPVIDEEIISRQPLEAWRSHSWNRIPKMTGLNTSEANAYVSKKMSEPSEFCTFWQTLVPNLSASELDSIEQLYPDPRIDHRSPYNETGEGLGAQFRRIEAAYEHYAYVAPVRQTAHLASLQGGLVYLYHWALSRIIIGANNADNM
jgi:carboxylesterase type B